MNVFLEWFLQTIDLDTYGLLCLVAQLTIPNRFS